MSTLSPTEVMECVAECAINRKMIPRGTAISNGTVVERPIMKLKRQVSFHNIQIREFAPTIGDQPSVSNGVPIALSNTKVREFNNVPIDTYERIRQPLRRQSSKQLIIKPNVRAELLLSEGYEREEIVDAAMAAYALKTSIQHSVQHKKWDNFNENLENTARLFSTVSRRPLLLQSKKCASVTDRSNRKNSSFSERSLKK